MGLDVDLGLERFGSAPEDEPKLVAMLEVLVKGGYTKSVREAFVNRKLPAAKRYATARIIDVTPKATVSLPDTKSAPIRKALAATLKRATSDSYSWDELEQLGAHDIQDLALVLDGKTKIHSFSPPVKFADNVSLKVTDLARLIGNWPASSVAYKLRELALAYRMIVHSA